MTVCVVGDLVGTNRRTVACYFHHLRKIISYHLEEDHKRVLER